MGKDFKEYISELTEDLFEDIFTFHIDEKKGPDDWDFEALKKEMLAQFGIDPHDVIKEDYHEVPYFELKDKLLEYIKYTYDEKEKMVGSEQLRELERHIMLQIIDSQWKDNLLNIDHLKEGIGLRGYAQKDPLVEYKKESFNLFDALREHVDEDVIRFLFLFRPIAEEEIAEWQQQQQKLAKPTKPTSKLPGKRHRGKK